MIQLAAPILGLLVLALLAIDVFRTAFHAEGRGGPINRRLNRVTWTTLRWAASRGGRRHAGILALGGPFMAIGTIVVWSGILLTGFALIYLPHIGRFHYSPGTPGSPLLEAFYYSGILAATLGHGDVVATGGWLRVLTVVEALAGFASVTVAVTYVLAVYRELVEAQTLAAAIDARLSAVVVREDGEHPPRQRTVVGGDDAASGFERREAANWDRTLALRLAGVIESHHNHPVLHYFRPSRPERSVPYQVARLFDAHPMGRSGQQAAEQPPAARGDLDAGISGQALAAIIRRYIAEVHALFVSSDTQGNGDEGGAEQLEEILSMLCYRWPEEGAKT